MARILLVDDDQDFATPVKTLLGAEGHQVSVAPGVAEARELLDDGDFDLMFVDLSLPDGSGLDLVASGGPRAVVITGHPSVETAIRAVRGPVVDYLVKPLDRKQLLQCIDEAVTPDRPKKRGGASAGEFGMIGGSDAMQAVYEQVREFGPTDVTVLVSGESGTGKDLVARALHEAGGGQGRFVAVNCGAIPQELIGSELFGHEKGSFTGAVGQRLGVFERAGKGTVFLDEIGELPLDQQVALLRVLENRSIVRVGGEKDIPVEARVVAASNRDLAKMVEEGDFREDLFYRLMVLPIDLLPLRERQGDGALLARHFLEQYAEAHNSPTEIAAEAMKRLERHDWPGNVRELKHTLLRTAILNRKETCIESLPEGFDRPLSLKSDANRLAPGTSIRDMERRLIEQTLEHFDGNKTQTAEALGISLKTLYNRLSEYEAEAAEPNADE